MCNYYRDALSNFKWWYVLLSTADPGSDHKQNSSISNCPTADTDLTTDGAISLFTSALNSTLIEHFETRFEKSKNATGVDASDFTFKSEGNKVQHCIYSERLEKRSTIERCLKFNKSSDALAIITEEKGVIIKRNKILKIADKHCWDTL